MKQLAIVLTALIWMGTTSAQNEECRAAAMLKSSRRLSEKTWRVELTVSFAPCNNSSGTVSFNLVTRGPDGEQLLPQLEAWGNTHGKSDIVVIHDFELRDDQVVRQVREITVTGCTCLSGN